MKAKTKQTAIQGTPMQVGAQVFEKFCLPALKATEGRPHHEIAQFYAGFVSATLGALAADFGHPRAVEMAQVLVDSFAALGAELTPPKPH